MADNSFIFRAQEEGRFIFLFFFHFSKPLFSLYLCHENILIFVTGAFQYVLIFILLTPWTPAHGCCKIHGSQSFLQSPEVQGCSHFLAPLFKIPRQLLSWGRFDSFWLKSCFPLIFFLSERLPIVKELRELVSYFFPGISYQLAGQMDWKLQKLSESISKQPKLTCLWTEDGHQSRKKSINEG